MTMTRAMLPTAEDVVNNPRATTADPAMKGSI